MQNAKKLALSNISSKPKQAKIEHTAFVPGYQYESLSPCWEGCQGRPSDWNLEKPGFWVK